MSFTPFSPKIEAGWRDLLSKLDLLGEYNKLVNEAIKNYEPEKNRFLRDVDEFEEEKIKELGQVVKTKEKPIYYEIIQEMLPSINKKLNDISLLRGLISSYSGDLFSVEKSSKVIVGKLSKLSQDYPSSSLPFKYSTKEQPLNLVSGLEQLIEEKDIDIQKIDITFVWNDELTKHCSIELKIYIELKKKFIPKPDVADKITVYFSDLKGLYITDNGVFLNYPVKKKRAKIIKELYKKRIEVEELMGKIPYDTLSTTLNEISRINKVFRKKLNLDFDIIVHVPTGGYTINRDYYNFQMVE